MLQGSCNKGSVCVYSHADIDPDAPICNDFRSGHCPHRGACPRKHFTQDMVSYYEQHPEAYAKVVAKARRRKSNGQAAPPRWPVPPEGLQSYGPGAGRFIRGAAAADDAAASSVGRAPFGYAPVETEAEAGLQLPEGVRVPPLLAGMPSPVFPGSEESGSVLFHIGGILVCDD